MLQRHRPELMLVVCTVIWGGTFPAVKYALEFSSAWLIVAMRFAIAGILFELIFRNAGQKINRLIFLRGVILGLFFFAGFGLQTLGLQYTSSSRSAFLTEALVIIIPVLSFVMSRKRPSLFTMTGAVFVMAGLYLLTSPAGFVDFNRGDWLTLGCALSFSFYIIGVDLWSTPESRGLLSTVQAFTVALLATPMAFCEGVRLQPAGGFILAMLYLILPGTIAVVMLQMRYQPQSTPARAGVIFALEPVFAMLYAVVLSFEGFAWRAVLGALVVTGGVVWSELGTSVWRGVLARVRSAGK